MESTQRVSAVESKRKSSSPLRIYLIAVAAGGAVALADYLIGLWMSARGMHAEATLLDEFLLAIFTGALVFMIKLSHQRDQDRLNEKVKTIELMNHHVRNSLQTIIDSAYVHGHLDEIHTPVDRISWALREILPGQMPHKLRGALPIGQVANKFPTSEGNPMSLIIEFDE